MLETFQSSLAAERLRAAGAFFERFPAAAEVLIVGASRDAADDLARRVTAARGATFGLHRASLTQLAVRFAAAEMARLGVTPATTLGPEAGGLARRADRRAGGTRLRRGARGSVADGAGDRPRRRRRDARHSPEPGSARLEQRAVGRGSGCATRHRGLRPHAGARLPLR